MENDEQCSHHYSVILVAAAIVFSSTVEAARQPYEH